MTWTFFCAGAGRQCLNLNPQNRGMRQHPPDWKLLKMRISDTNYGTEHGLSSAPSPYQSSPPPGAEIIITACAQCGAHQHEWSGFCKNCGTPLIPMPPLLPVTDNPHPVAARGAGQLLGLHPIPAVMTLSVNAMMFGAEVGTLGAAFPAALAAAVVLAFIVYRAQIKWYGDDHESALIKAMAVGLLTAIPTGLPAFLTVPSAVVGLVHTLRRKVS